MQLPDNNLLKANKWPGRIIDMNSIMLQFANRSKYKQRYPSPNYHRIDIYYLSADSQVVQTYALVVDERPTMCATCHSYTVMSSTLVAFDRRQLRPIVYGAIFKCACANKTSVRIVQVVGALNQMASTQLTTTTTSTTKTVLFVHISIACMCVPQSDQTAIQT